VILGVETGGLLIGEGAGREEVRTIRQIIASEASVVRVGDVLTMQLGPDEVLLVAEVDFRDELGSLDLKRSIDDIERRVREQNPAVKRIFFEAESLKKNDRGTERAA
jgi:divalent metal cation (Fe/Co/Zn/Cd) transporter